MNKKKEILLKTLNSIRTSLNKALNHVCSSEVLIDDPDEIEANIISAYSACLDSVFQLQDAKEILPQNTRYEKIDIPASLRMRKEDNCYHYILNSRLPHRLKYRTTDSIREVSTLRDRSIIYNGYYNGVMEYLSNHSIPMFSQRILVVFINFYTEEHSFYDEDNLDIKPFIDAAINKILVPDDNNQFVSIALCSKIGAYDHTEVYAGPKEAVIKYLV